MITKEINGKEYLFVEVPEDAIDFDLPEQDFGNIVQFKGNKRWSTVAIPEGNYTIIGKADKINYAWSSIVERESDGSGSLKGWWYKNYMQPDAMLKDHIESGLSLIKSIGMKPENCLLIIKN